MGIDVQKQSTQTPLMQPRAEGNLHNLLSNLTSGPSSERARRNYHELAPDYDDSCRKIEGIRRRAIMALAVRPGETVADVACGTGATLIQLGQAVGEHGKAIGLELSDDMAMSAFQKIEAEGLQDRCQLRVGPIENYFDSDHYDALLFCYTHDVLQSPYALHALFAHARDGARVAVAGARFLPWWWGLPLNMFTAYRGRRYLTTFAGLRRPWRYLLDFCPDFHVIGTDHLGTSYLGTGTFKYSAEVFARYQRK